MQLSVKYSRSISWIVKQRDEYIVDIKAHNPRTVNLVCDATFYGKRKEKRGSLALQRCCIKRDTYLEAY